MEPPCKRGKGKPAYKAKPYFRAMDKQWLRRDCGPHEDIERLVNELKISSVMATLMAQRGISDLEGAKAYFNPSTSQLHDPFEMHHMDRAVARIEQAVEQDEKILFYGDYDVDGTTSVALMILYLKPSYPNIGFYIPDRQKEGYGISEQGIAHAAQQGFGLIVAIDCGITALAQAAMARDLGIDLIIADHHIPGPILPEAYAILNPKKAECQYPYKELSGCGIAFKLICALAQRSALSQADPYQFIDLVALSIASDIVPLTGENRILAHFGLEKLNTQPLAGIAQIMETAGYDRRYDIADVVFKIGPRINAAGRLAHAHSAVELLIGGSPLVLGKLAEDVNDLNDNRKGLERNMVAEALEIMANDAFQAHSFSTVVYAPHWHKGVVGIVAAKLVEQVYKPTVVLTNGDNGLLVGSARTVEGFDLYTALAECRDLFVKFGGHQAAAGLSLPYEHLEAFRQRFDIVVRERVMPDMMVPKVWFDLEMGIGHLSWNLLKNIERMGPFGPMNMRPVFVSRQVPILDLKVMAGNHMRFQVRTPRGGSMDAVAFNQAAHYEALCAQPVADLCYALEWRQWRENKYLQLNIKDIKQAQS